MHFNLNITLDSPCTSCSTFLHMHTTKAVKCFAWYEAGFQWVTVEKAFFFLSDIKHG